MIDDWLNSVDDQRSLQTHNLKSLYELQEKFLFNQYEPVNAINSESGLPFINRIEKWISTFDNEDDKWAAFHSLRYFLFIGIKETEELYRCAVRDNLYKWLVDEERLDIFSNNVLSSLQAVINYCWPCPITDSLRINSLLHRTGLTGQPLRPDWYSLKKLGSEKKIKEYVKNKEIKYLVLFEDFVGSGNQCKKVVDFALRVFDGKIFLSPLVVCHPGDQILREIEKKYSGRLKYSPVTILSSECLIGKTRNKNEPLSFDKTRNALVKGSIKAKFKFDKNDGPHGYNNVGSLFCSFSNCPNNTPPIFHRTSKAWPHPIFPRNSRV